VEIDHNQIHIYNNIKFFIFVYNVDLNIVSNKDIIFASSDIKLHYHVMVSKRTKPILFFYFYRTVKNDMQFGIMTKEGLYFGFDIN
jgi:hypothetical protein